MAQATQPRYHSEQSELVPRILVRGLVGLVLVCLVMVTVFVASDQPKDATPPQSAIAVQKVLYLEGAMSGAARVLAEDGALIADLSPEEGGFVSGMWRVLQRERTKARVALDGPVTLTAYENGRVAIFDPSTGWGADLMGFGQDNAKAFAKLLAH